MGNPRILIVEDEDTVRHVMEAVLDKEGYDTTSAPDAEQAVEAMQKSAFDLVITDLHLPRSSGIDVLKRARSICADTTVIVMTAFGTIQSAVEAMRAGAYDYLSKPIHPYDL